MATGLYTLTDSELRSICRERLEALEHWLRRLIEDTLSPIYGDYFSYIDISGSRLIKKKIAEEVEVLQASNPQRYLRKIDAILLSDAIDIVCKPELFRDHFAIALRAAFPDGREEARTFLKRLLPPRNCLAHANPISVRQAEQVVCYSNDVIDSLKQHYATQGMEEEYNVPTILKMIDSFGGSYMRSQFVNIHDGGIMLTFFDNNRYTLRPGDVLSLEVEVDPSFSRDEYEVSWTSVKGLPDGAARGNKLVLTIEERHVAKRFSVQCKVKSNKLWHRMEMGADDFMLLYYKVLPPIA